MVTGNAQLGATCMPNCAPPAPRIMPNPTQIGPTPCMPDGWNWSGRSGRISPMRPRGETPMEAILGLVILIIVISLLTAALEWIADHL